ncbi:sel1 repeat family protein [Paraburkholderia sp. UCT31]|uniref:sel1 repeat family protein n=1 Tax=Paraburkholderia sp. UCT31 TaxID=2615209 RepID=UPI001654D549|nr:sel1 repeat family protein [Paraburkholderia sp. UCT31]MBC8740384.1 sel1 repeat family protein [Paraburkholderia sp. UCT31]
MSVESWGQQVETEWRMLKAGSTALDVEKFYRHAVSAHKVGALTPESVATIANQMLISTLDGAPYLGRKLLEQVSAANHPATRLALAISLATGTGGPANPEVAHGMFQQLIGDEQAGGALKALAAAALADSFRLGRGVDQDIDFAKSHYDLAIGLGHIHSALALGLYWEGKWGVAATGDELPDIARAIHFYKRGRDACERCAARLATLESASTAA